MSMLVIPEEDEGFLEISARDKGKPRRVWRKEELR
jgi:hypothetical protein